MRLDMYLAQSSLGTRKKVREIIANGRIAVNGQTEYNAAMDITVGQTDITCDGDKVTYRGREYYMFYKPKGCISARYDENHKTVMEYFKDVDLNGIFIVGRLDKDTEGLLLLTNDGELDHRLMCPDKHVNKTYYFVATGHLSAEAIRKIENGVVIRDGGAMTKTAQLSDVVNYRIEAAQEQRSTRVRGHLTICEGQKHQVKRMLRLAGCRVLELKRISIGGLQLDESLLPGEYRRLTEEEVLMI